jgi:hypothetical protein
MDPYHFEKPDPDLHQSQKPDPDPLQNQNSEAVEAQNRALAGNGHSHNGGVEAQNGAVEDWRACRPVVADLHHIGEVQDPDPDPDPHPHPSEQSDPDPRQNIQRDPEPDPHHSAFDPQHWF